MRLNDFPELVAEWHPTRNTADLNKLTQGSTRVRVWWLGVCGHEWDSTVQDRTRGAGCPYCANRKVLKGFNDFASRKPDITAEWHPTRNGNLTPEQVVHGSSKTVWWLGECGHEWESRVINRTEPNQCPYCNGSRVLPGFNDLKTTHPELAAQWHPTRNDNLTPEQVSAGSNKKAWWLGVCDHEWESTVNKRKNGNGCPYCAGKRVLPGFNDLASRHPELVKQWDMTRNKSLTPEQVTTQSFKKAWWECENNHQWQAPVYSRVNGNGCPYCAGKQPTYERGQKLSRKHPELENIYASTNLTPFSEVTVASKTKYDWVCVKGHIFTTTPNIFRKGYTCPVCSGKQILSGFNDLNTTHKEYVDKHWNFKKNTLKPTQISKGSMKKVWWNCDEGHPFLENPNTILRDGRGCPVCSGKQIIGGVNDLQTVAPLVAAQWHPTRNGDLNPEQVTAGSGVKVWWVCGEEHEWEAVINNRVALNFGCPKCMYTQNPSKNEEKLRTFIEKLGIKVETNNRTILEGLELDILVPSHNFAVEYNGVYWHSENAGKDKTYHQNKWLKCKEQGIQLLQVWEDDYKRNPELVERMITHKLGMRSGSTVYARNTMFIQVPARVAETFLNSNHLQGYKQGAKYFGLQTEENKLVAVLGVTLKKNNILEVARFATNTTVPGGFSKLLKNVLKEETYTNIETVYSYSHNDHSDGGLYKVNGFTLKHEGKPGYAYIVDGVRVPRTQFTKNKFKNNPDLKFREGLIEKELAKLNDLHRVWDAGSSLWVKNLV